MADDTPKAPCLWAPVWDEVAGGSATLTEAQQDALTALYDAVQVWHLEIMESWCGPHDNVMRPVWEGMSAANGTGLLMRDLWAFVTYAMQPDHLPQWPVAEFDPYNTSHVFTLLGKVARAARTLRQAREEDPDRRRFFGNTYEGELAKLQAERVETVRMLGYCLLGDMRQVNDILQSSVPSIDPGRRVFQHPVHPEWRKWEDDRDWIRDDGVKLSRTHYGRNSATDDQWLAHGQWRVGAYGSQPVGRLRDLTLEQAMEKMKDRKPAQKGSADIWAPGIAPDPWF
jgi:hypothetical protein